MLIHEIILCNLMVMNRPTWHVNIGLVSPFQDVMKYTEILWNTHPVFMGHQVMNIEYISPGFNVKGGIKFRGNCCEMVAKMVDECLTSPFGPSGWYGLVPLKEGIPKFQNMIVGFPKGTVILGPSNVSRVLDCILRFCHRWILMWYTNKYSHHGFICTDKFDSLAPT